MDLDHEMPGVAWDLLPMPSYRAHNWHCFGHLQRQPYAALYTTLGCPYRCSFCAKDNAEVRRLIAGPNGVFICNECVAKCNEILAKEEAMV